MSSQTMAGPTSFPLQGKPKQWCNLGCKALERNNYKKAVILPMSTQNRRSKHKHIYHALAEAYFNINEHERALDAGKTVLNSRQ